MSSLSISKSNTVAIAIELALLVQYNINKTYVAGFCQVYKFNNITKNNMTKLKFTVYL